jgi:hypothetical protein
LNSSEFLRINTIIFPINFTSIQRMADLVGKEVEAAGV